MSDEDLEAIMDDWNDLLFRWLTDTTNYPHLTFYLASQAVVDDVADIFVSKEEDLNAFHKKNAGRIFSLSLYVVITSYHPEWFHNERYGRRSGDARWTAGCITLDEIGTMIRISFFGPDAPPCDIGEQYLLKVYDSPQMIRLMKQELEKSPKDWLIANCRSTAIVMTDDSVPKATKNYLSKSINKDELLEYLLTKHGIELGGVEEVRVYLLHSFMCHLGGVASGELRTRLSSSSRHTSTMEAH